MNAMKVLLVDDEKEFLELLTMRLTKRNIEVRSASSGEEALAALSEGGFDVVVLDVRMPGMDGIETLSRMKALAPDVEVIMLTGHANTEVAERGMEMGSFDYLIKPVSINELLIKLQDACRKKRLMAKEL